MYILAENNVELEIRHPYPSCAEPEQLNMI